MEQLRQVGEVLGSLKALMIFRDDINVNRRQCELLVDAFNVAFDSIAGEVRTHLKFDEKLAKWKPLEQPLRELLRIFREGEQYVKSCLEPKDWSGKAIALSRSTDCVELHLHNLLCCVPIVIEAVETASDISGSDVIFSRKYDKERLDQAIFEHEFGKLYMVPANARKRFDSVPREDRWLLSETIEERKPLRKLAELLLSPRAKLHPTSAIDYQVRRRLGSGGNLKEIQWMGESFAMRRSVGDVEQFKAEVERLAPLAHPNVLGYNYAFCDDATKEGYLVMDLMSKDLSSYIKEICCPRRRVPFPLPVAVDIMLQIVRGMQYLHSRGIYHGNLNPSNVLVKPSLEGYMLVKIANFGSSQSVANGPCIWYAPEVLSDGPNRFKYTEKADVFSFAMLCFELLTGKVPLNENHLQGDKLSRNIKADARPLFPFPFPKYLAGLTKRCWHAEPANRPSFGLICRVLRYIKRFLILNPDKGQPDLPAPPLDYFEIEASLSRRVAGWAKEERVADVPFEMYAYRVVERERTSANVVKDRCSDSGSDAASVCGEENGEDAVSSSAGSSKSNSQASSESSKKESVTGKFDEKMQRKTGQQKSRTGRLPPKLTPRTLRSNGLIRQIGVSPARKRASGHASDSELSL